MLHNGSIYNLIMYLIGSRTISPYVMVIFCGVMAFITFYGGNFLIEDVLLSGSKLLVETLQMPSLNFVLMPLNVMIALFTFGIIFTFSLGALVAYPMTKDGYKKFEREFKHFFITKVEEPLRYAEIGKIEAYLLNIFETIEPFVLNVKREQEQLEKISKKDNVKYVEQALKVSNAKIFLSLEIERIPNLKGINIKKARLLFLLKELDLL